jgi:hypothetical protein
MIHVDMRPIKIRRLAAAIVLTFALAVPQFAPKRSLATQNSPRMAQPSVAMLQSYGYAGKQQTILKPGRQVQLINHRGSGCLTYMWFAGGWRGFDHTVIRIYINGSTTPCISMQLGMGHGMGYRVAKPWGVGMIGQTGIPSGVYDTYQIPYQTSIRVTAQLAPSVKKTPVVWWIIHGTDGLRVRIHGVTLPANARLCLYKRVDIHEKPLQYFKLCNVHGPGELFAVDMKGMSTGNFNYMEGCMRAYTNGSKTPELISSGLEDFFTGTGYFAWGIFHTPVGGCTCINNRSHAFSAYRFFTRDPFFFQHSLKLVCRDGERLGGYLYYDPQPAVYTTYTWVYRW